MSDNKPTFASDACPECGILYSGHTATCSRVVKVEPKSDTPEIDALVKYMMVNVEDQPNFQMVIDVARATKRENTLLCAFINKHLQMTGNDPRIEEIVRGANIEMETAAELQQQLSAMKQAGDELLRQGVCFIECSNFTFEVSLKRAMRDWQQLTEEKK